MTPPPVARNPRRLLAWCGALLIALTALSAEAASTLLRRTPGSILVGPVAIWTDGTTTAVFHPMSEPMALADTNKVRVAFALSEITTNARARPALRFSNDGVTWDSAQPIDNSTLPYVITETITFGSGYVDLNTAPVTGQKSWVQFGVQAANSSAGAIGFGNATLRIEVRRGE